MLPTPAKPQNSRPGLICLCLALMLPMEAGAVNYAYRSTGEYGEVVFSDIPGGATAVITLTQSTSPAPSSADQVQSMLQVADELAAARMLREQAREERRKRAAQVERATEQARHEELLQRQWTRHDRYPAHYYHPLFPGYAHDRHPPSNTPVESPTGPAKSFRFELK